MIMTRRMHKLRHWVQQRNPQYIALRLTALMRRYGLTSAKARRRTLACVQFLAQYDCYPTFPTPGRVVRRHRRYFQTLQAMGAEFAVHGYDHVDFHSLSREEALRQFERATDVYRQAGLRYSGFRCPYLSYSKTARAAIPDGMFRYSSNRAISWDVIPPALGNKATAIFASLSHFYRAEPARTTLSMPTFNGNMVEIPASLPDDLQLFDGLKLGEQGMIQPWIDILHLSHQRGEAFVLLFHPESFHHCRQAFDRVLREAQQLQPAVWVTQLREISEWWWEKAQFGATVTAEPTKLIIQLNCSARATVLVRNLDLPEGTLPWYGSYQACDRRILPVATNQRPFVGLIGDVPDQTRIFLTEQGYIVESGPDAERCTIQIDAATAARLNQVQLIDHIETTDAPLVRFSPWPAGYRSALCISGDLDALSLADYATRLLPW